MNIPPNLKYTKSDEWFDPASGAMGISDYAQDQLGDIVFVELPQIGSHHAKGEQFGTIESVKAVSELYMPLGGEVLSINKVLEDSPELVNKEPYGSGWIIEIKPSDPGELKGLMNRDAYLSLLKGLKP